MKIIILDNPLHNCEVVVNTINLSDMIVITVAYPVHLYGCEKLNYIHVVLTGHMDRHDNI